jgi:hypothetical protein
MTKRYFYTDPLAAAWMAKHFGMRFTDEGWLNTAEVDYQHTGVERIPLDIKTYIHPDSLHLLEPQVGDKDERGLIYKHCSYHDKMSWVQDRGENWCDENGRTVIRDGIVFMHPQSDDTAR